MDPAFVLTAIRSPSIQAKSRLSSSGFSFMKLLTIVKKLKCFCSQKLAFEAYCEIMKRIPREELNVLNNVSTKKHFHSTQVCCESQGELRNQSNWKRSKNFLSAALGPVVKRSFDLWFQQNSVVELNPLHVPGCVVFDLITLLLFNILSCQI